MGLLVQASSILWSCYCLCAHQINCQCVTGQCIFLFSGVHYNKQKRKKKLNFIYYNIIWGADIFKNILSLQEKCPMKSGLPYWKNQSTNITNYKRSDFSLKLVSYLCSSDIKMASFVRRILHSMLLMIYEWPNQLKLWYMHKPFQIIFLLILKIFYLEKWCMANSFKLMGAGSCHHLHLQLHCICYSTGPLVKPTSLVEKLCFLQIIYLLIPDHFRRLHGLANAWRPTTLLVALFGCFLVQQSFSYLGAWVLSCT